MICICIFIKYGLCLASSGVFCHRSAIHLLHHISVWAGGVHHHHDHQAGECLLLTHAWQSLWITVNIISDWQDENDPLCSAKPTGVVF